MVNDQIGLQVMGYHLDLIVHQLVGHKAGDQGSKPLSGGS
jgi:hypothetical protein